MLSGLPSTSRNAIISTILRMERDENEQRLDFTPSERVAIARRIEESLAGRQGNPTGANQYATGKSNHDGNGQNFVQFQRGKSGDIAARAVDMNRETYRQAKSVVDSGNQEAIEKMDKGELSIHAAYEQVKRGAAATIEDRRPALAG